MFYSYAYPNILSWLKTALRNPCICFVKCIVSLWSLFLFKLEKELLVWWLNSCLITCFCLFPCYMFCQDTLYFFMTAQTIHIYLFPPLLSLLLLLNYLHYGIRSNLGLHSHFQFLLICIQICIAFLNYICVLFYLMLISQYSI